MPADISINQGRVEMMYAGAKPWHGMGTYVGEQEVTAAEAIKAAGMDWEVAMEPVYRVLKPESEVIPVVIEHRKAVVRKDTGKVFEILSDRYRPLQNREAFSFFDSIVQEKAAIYHTAGVLGVGQTVWILAKLPGHIRVGQTDDITEKFLLLANSHNGTSAVWLKSTPIRVVCSNTLSMAMTGNSRTSDARIIHATNLSKKVEWARKQLGLVNDWYQRLQEVMTAAAAKPMPSVVALTDYIKASGIPIQKNIPTKDGVQIARHPDALEVMRLFERGQGARMPGIQGSWWAAYNAITEWLDHHRGSTKKTTEVRRWERANFGDGLSIKKKAWDGMLERVKV
jgi:phage/plasmid-like protein (TIGR03299 family)